MVSLLLLKQILQLFFMIFLGWLVVRSGLLKPADSRVLSVVVLYVVTPCVIIHSFQIGCTPEMLRGLGLSLGAAVLIHALAFLVTGLCRRPLRLAPVEQASLIYSNAGNLIIPIVSAILGPEWVVFTSMFVIIQLPLLWSHCRILLSGESALSLRTVLLNVNILSILVGAALFFLKISLPEIVVSTMTSIGGMIGPLSMLVAGMLMGGADLRQVFRSARVWKVAVLRLVIFPLLALCLLKYSGLAALAPNGETILFITLLAASSPAASAVTQIAQVYSDAGEQAGAINVVTTLLCILTMPVMAALYQL